MKSYPFLKSRLIKNVNGMNINILENDVKRKKDNIIIMLHGFPEISFSFRYLIKLFSKKGYYCVAPDQRGYGRTHTFANESLNSFSVLNLTKDIYVLMNKLNIKKFHIIGHDFGAYIASYFNLIYPKHLHSITIMSRWCFKSIIDLR